MSEERCPVCDRVRCPVAPFRAMDYVEFDATAGIPGEKKYMDYLAIERDCNAHAQDWRQRALKAEAALVDYRKAVAEQFHYDMNDVLSNQAERRTRIAELERALAETWAKVDDLRDRNAALNAAEVNLDRISIQCLGRDFDETPPRETADEIIRRLTERAETRRKL